MNKQAIFLTLLAVLGAYFLGEGITGFAIISQSCCISEDCPPELACENVNDIYEDSIGTSSIFIGMLVVLSCVILFHKFIANVK